MRNWFALTLVLPALLSTAAAQSAGDPITAVRGGIAFAADGSGAPRPFAVGDTFALDRMEEEGARWLVYFRPADRTETYRADAEAFGVEPPDPWAVRRGAPHQTRYTHGSVNVRSGPGASNRQLTQLGRGDRVYVLACHDGWCRVEIPHRTDTDTRTFVAASLLHESPPPARTITRSRSSARSGSSGEAVAVRCSGITRRGTRCLRRTTNPSGRCYQH